MVTNVTVRGILAILLTVGCLGYFLLYKDLPTDLLVIWSTLMAYYFGNMQATGALPGQEARPHDVLVGKSQKGEGGQGSNGNAH